MVKWNKKEINKALDKLGMSNRWRNQIVNLDNFLSHDITMQLSIRADAGKTTSALCLGLALNKLYSTTILYQRCDNSQIVASIANRLFNVIRDNNYISKMYDDEYNDVQYYPLLHHFTLVKKEIDKDGNLTIIKEREKPLCICISLEKWQDYKSGMNETTADYMIFDEFMDTKRATHDQIIELENNISTFLRPTIRDNGHCLMLGNNQNQYSFWFEEFCIEKMIANLKFGGYIENNTEMGTTFCCELLSQSDEHKENIKKKKIRFSGFNTPKMNAFNGLSEWQGKSYPHIQDNKMLEIKPKFNNFYIKHRTRFIKICLYYSKDYGYYAYLHYAPKPLYNDNIILTEFPEKFELFGFGEQAKNETVRQYCKAFLELWKSNRIYFYSNSVGTLFDDYATQIRLNARR